MKEIVVAKVGGSVARRNVERIKGVMDELSLADRVVVIPGGWVFADFSRLIDWRLKLGNKTAHRLGIMSMEMYAEVLLGTSREFEGVEIRELRFEREGKYVLMPYSSKLYELLPESWEVTSDSVAVWVANELKSKYRVRVVKITDVDGIYVNGKLVEKIRAEEVKGCLDSYSLKLIRKCGISVFVCNGVVEGRVKSYIVEGRTLGTLVY